MPEVRLASRLHEFELLPEEHRAKFVRTVSDYAADGSDTTPLDSRTIRSLFTAHDYDNLVRRVRLELLPRLDEVRFDHQLIRSSDTPADEHMYEFVSSLATLKKCFAGDADALKAIDRETDRVNDWTSKNSNDEPEREPRKIGKVSKQQNSKMSRSIFDDIDADDSRADG